LALPEVTLSWLTTPNVKNSTFGLARFPDLELSGKRDLHGRFAVNPEISLCVQMSRLYNRWRGMSEER
jgi:hypothetical protein